LDESERKPMKALIIADLQNDFLPGGTLGVPNGDTIIPVINSITGLFDMVIATQDWHPADHESFASVHGKIPGETIGLHGISQILWPDHCIQDSRGSELAPGFILDRVTKIFRKGTHKEIDSYSCFFENDRKTSTGLADYLKAEKITEVYVCGLATDYCVKYSALDAAALGFETYLIADASRGVNIKPGDVEKAIEEMEQAGIIILTTDLVIEEFQP